jgi:hypothetical protein
LRKSNEVDVWADLVCAVLVSNFGYFFLVNFCAHARAHARVDGGSGVDRGWRCVCVWGGGGALLHKCFSILKLYNYTPKLKHQRELGFGARLELERARTAVVAVHAEAPDVSLSVGLIFLTSK